MADNISFSIQNPNAKPADAPDLFIGQDSSLIFVFSISKGLGLTELSPGDQFNIIIPNTLLASADSSNLVDANWEVQSLKQPSTNDPNFTFGLTPKSAITVNNNEVRITFGKLQGISQTNDEVSTQYNIQNTKMLGSTEKLFVVNPPNQRKNLRDAVTFTAYVNDDQQFVSKNLVYISPENLQPPIPNRVHVNLAFSGQNLGSNGSTSKPPKFLFSFSYGGSFNDLTDAIKEGQPGRNALTSAWSIVASIDNNENNLWVLEPLDPSNNTPIWVVEPAPGNSNIFGPNQGLDLYFDQIITIRTVGVAYVYIQWANIPGYNDGAKALPLEKQVRQAKLTLASPQNEKTIGPSTPVTLNWTAFAAKNLEITWDSGNQSKTLAYDSSTLQLIYSGSDNTIVPDSPLTDFLLNANFDANGNGGIQSNTIRVTVSDFPAPTITQFSAGLKKDASGNVFVAMSWLVENLGEGGHFILSNGTRIDGTAYNGHLYTHPNIPVDPSVPFENTFTLEAVGSNGLTKTETIQATIPDWYAPEITDFTGEFKRDGGTPTSLLLTFKVKNAIYTKNNPDASTKCQISDWPITLNDKGEATLPIHIDNTQPEFSLQTMLTKPYILTVTNPDGQWDKKSTKVQFAKTKTIGAKFGNNTGYVPFALAIIPDVSKCFAFFRPTATGDEGLYNAIFNTGSWPDAVDLMKVTGAQGDMSYKGIHDKLVISPDNKVYFINFYSLLYIDMARHSSLNYYESDRNPPDVSQTQPIISMAICNNGSTIIAGYGTPSGIEGRFLAVGQLQGSVLQWMPFDKLQDLILIQISDLAYSPDKNEIFFADYTGGIWISYSTINADSIPIAGYHVVSIAINNNDWTYWIGAYHNGSLAGRLHCLDPKQSSYYYLPSTAVGTFNENMKVVAGDLFVFLADPQNSIFYVLSASQNFKGTNDDILQTASLKGLSDLTVMPDNSTFLVASNDGIEVWEAGLTMVATWLVLPGSQGEDIAISDDGALWLTNQVGYIYKWDGTTWPPQSGMGHRISAGGGQVWLVNKTGQIYKLNGSSWGNPMPGAGRDIAVSDIADVWLTNDLGIIYKWDDGINNWTTMSGVGVGYHISAGGDQVWVVNDAGNISRFNKVSKGWDLMPGSHGHDIAVSNDGAVWYTNSEGLLYKWDGNGKTWIQHDFVRAKNISANNGNLFVVGLDGYIYKLS